MTPESRSFAAALLALAREKRSATVVAVSADRRHRALLKLARGRIEAIEGPSADPDFLVASGLVAKRKIDKAQKSPKGGETAFLPKVLVDDGALDRAAWLELARKGALKDIAAVAARRPVSVQVGLLRPEDLPPAGFSLSIDLAALGVELLRREPAEAEALLPKASETFVRAAAPAPEALKEADSRLLSAVAAEPLGTDDAVRASGHSPEDGRLALLKLEAQGLVRRASPRELVDSAREKLAAGRLDLFLRAAERARIAGADSAALHREIGEVRLLVGQDAAALEDFARAAARAEEEDRPDVVAAALEKIVAVLPPGSDRRAARLRRLAALEKAGGGEALREESALAVDEAVAAGDLAAAEDAVVSALRAGLDDPARFEAFEALGAERSVRPSALWRSILLRVDDPEARVRAARRGCADPEASIDDLRAFARAVPSGPLGVSLRERLLEKTGGAVESAEDLLRIAPDHLGALGVLSEARSKAGEKPVDLLKRRLASSTSCGDAAERLAALRGLNAVGALDEPEREALARETDDESESAAILIEIARGREERGDAAGALRAAAEAVARRPLDAAAAETAARCARDAATRAKWLVRAAAIRALEGLADVRALAESSPLAAARLLLLFPELDVPLDLRTRLGEAAMTAGDSSSGREILSLCRDGSGAIDPGAEALLSRAVEEEGARPRRLDDVEADLGRRIEREAAERAAAIAELREEMLAAIRDAGDCGGVNVSAGEGDDRGTAAIFSEVDSIASQLEAAARVSTRPGASASPSTARATGPDAGEDGSLRPSIDSIASQLAAAARFSGDEAEVEPGPAPTSAPVAAAASPLAAAGPGRKASPAIPVLAPAGGPEGIADIVRRLKDVKLA